jgi:VWFA-related protein
VLSDGGDNNSSYSKRQLQRLVREADVQIYSISLFEGSRLLESVSEETGGRMYQVHAIGELPDTIEKLSREIRSRYVLTYYSSRSQNDGKYRRLNVAVADPMLRVSWRRGYYAPLE